MKEYKVIILLYNRFFDPLIQGNFWLYINDYLINESDIKFYLITYEDNRFPLTYEQIKKVENWKKQGLEWIRLQWHPGTGIINKCRDIISGFFSVARLRIKGCYRIITLASVAGSYGYLYAKLLRMNLFLYQFEPHSEYAVDNRTWRKDSLNYKILNYLEKKSAEFATVVTSGTCFMQERIELEWKVKAKFFKIPTVVDDKKFLFKKEIRDEIRRKLNIKNNKFVILYPGKFGGLYYYEEIALMYKWLYELDQRLHFLIVTPHEKKEIYSLFDKAGVNFASYSVYNCSYDEIHRYYFASDFAIIAVPPGKSKKFISNIKVGEYLCTGLPFLITRGVSEDYLYAENYKVGVVVDDFNEKDIKDAWQKIKKYLEMDQEEKRNRCRTIGISYRGFEKLNRIFKDAIDFFLKESKKKY
jgi:hypothetical protein